MQVKLRTFVPSWAPAVTIDKRWFIGAGLLLKGKERHAAYGATACHCRGFSHTVTRWMPSRLQIEVTLSPLARAVRIASTSVSVSCVRERLAGFNTTPDSGSAVRGPSLPTPRFACSHAELSRSSRFHVFGPSPPASTRQKARSVRTGPSSSWRPARRRDHSVLPPPPAQHPRRSRPGCGPASIRHRRRTALSRQVLANRLEASPPVGPGTPVL